MAWKLVLQLQVTCRLNMTITRQRKKDIGEIEKIEKFSKKICVHKCVDFPVCYCVC